MAKTEKWVIYKQYAVLTHFSMAIRETLRGMDSLLIRVILWNQSKYIRIWKQQVRYVQKRKKVQQICPKRIIWNKKNYCCTFSKLNKSSLSLIGVIRHADMWWIQNTMSLSHKQENHLFRGFWIFLDALYVLTAQIRSWDTLTGEELKTLESHK